MTSSHQPFSNQTRLLLFSLLFLFSGAAGLIYQIVWERLLELYFGVTMTAVTLIVGAFMAGLGLGSLFGGRFAERYPQVLLAYGLAEIGIGLFGFFSPALFTRVGAATAGSPYGLVFILSFLLLLIPTFLMGATLPLLSQGFINRVETSGQTIGILYGINTLGAASGAFGAAYFLIGPIGFDGALNVAVAINLIVGMIAVALNRIQATGRLIPETNAPTATPAIRLGYPTLLGAAFLVGFIGLGFEMLWVRTLFIVNKNTAYGFPTILAIFLTGLAIGGYYWGRRADRATDPVTLFWQVEVSMGIIAGIAFLFFYYGLSIPTLNTFLVGGFTNFQNPLPAFVDTPSGFVFSRRALIFNLLSYLRPVLILVLPASLMMGGLPMLDRIAIEDPHIAGRRVGDLHLANIIGSVAGTLTISFILLPQVGSEGTLHLLVLLTLTFPLMIFLNRRAFRWSKSTIGLIVAVLIVTAILPGRSQFYTRLYETGSKLTARVLETNDSVLALTEADDSGLLWIGGEVNSGFPTDGGYERSLLTCAAANPPQRILIIGFGGGNTAFFALNLPNVHDVVVVELMHELDGFLAANIPTAASALTDPRLNYINDDGRRYLNANPGEKFDLITLDPLRRYTAGHNNLYSIEALRLYKKHLTENGVLCLWHDEGQVIPFTTAQVFPELDTFGDFTVAGLTPLSYNVEYMQTTAMQYIDTNQIYLAPTTAVVLNPTNILRSISRTRAQTLQAEAGQSILTDLHPRLEYYLFTMPTRRLKSDFEARQDLGARLLGCDVQCLNPIIK